MAFYDNISLEKGMYSVTGKTFTDVLEELDPSGNYKNTELEGLDAFQRQLKRFDIKVSGPKSDVIAKFFNTTQTSALFPEYVRRVVSTSINENNAVENIVAATTYIDSLDYRTFHSSMTDESLSLTPTNEGTTIPETNISLNSGLVHLIKRGRMLVASYEALKYQKIDAFSTVLKQIGNYISVSAFNDCIDEIITGESIQEEIDTVSCATSGTLTYGDLISLYQALYPYQLNTIVCTSDTLRALLMMDEMRDATAGLNFHSTGNLVTPFGAKVQPNILSGTGTLLGFDNRYTIEMIKAGDVQIEYDKLIDRQLERAAITSTYGFSKLTHGSSVQLEV